jgi:protein TonB
LRNIRPAVFIFVSALHGLLFLFGSVKYHHYTAIGREEAAPLKLVNINIMEAEPPNPSENAAEEAVRPPADIQQAAPAEPAEHIVEIEDAPVEKSVMSGYEVNPVEDSLPEQYDHDGHGEKSDDESNGKTDAAKNAALAREYVERNFDYISRRVRSKLVYPAQARRTGLDGIVEVLFTLHTDGSVSGISVKKSAGVAMLDAAAIAAIESAAPFRAPPVSVKLLIPVVFNLR